MNELAIAFMVLWFVLIIGAAVVEVLTMDLTSVWFSIGALVAFILGIVGVNPIVQLLVFIVVSVALLLSVRPLAKNYFRTNIISTNSDRLVGRTAICTKPIEAGARGEVKVEGKIWTAISNDASAINEGDKVEILAIEGVKLIVVKV